MNHRHDQFWDPLDSDTNPGLPLDRRYRQLKAVHLLATAVNQAPTLEEIYEVALDGLLSALGISRAAFLTWDEAGAMRFRAWRGLSEAYRTAVDGHSPWSRQTHEAQPLLIESTEDPSLNPAIKQALLAEGIGGLAFIPLVHQGDLLGKMMIYTSQPRGLGAEDIELALTVAEHVAFSLARKQADTRRIESEFRQETLLRAMPVVLYESEVPSPQAATWVSSNCERISGYAADDLMQIPNLWDQNMHADDRAAFREALDKTCTLGQAEVEYRWRHRDGTWRWFLDRMKRSDESIPERMRVVGVLLDTTQSRLAEEAIRESQKLESLGLLAGGIAHDFNNLLTAMTGNLNLIQVKLPQSSGVHHHLANLEQCIEKAAHLTRQMLAYSGRGNLASAPVDLNRTLTEIAGLLRASLPHQIHLQLNPCLSLPLVVGDAAQIHLVLMNLVSNAEEAIGAQDGNITLTTRHETLTAEHPPSPLPSPPLPPGDYAVIEVADSGEGIAAAYLDRIWDPFFTTREAGRGLGLPAVQGILRAHSGAISIQTEVGAGTRIALYFPESISMSDSQKTVKKSLPVLAVDDDPMILDIVCETLSVLGLEVHTARNGQEAIDRFEAAEGRYGMVLMDLTMPTMDGRTAARLMRKKNPRIPIVLSSGYHLNPKGDHESDGDFVAFLRKPYTLGQLRAVLQDLHLV